VRVIAMVFISITWLISNLVVPEYFNHRGRRVRRGREERDGCFSVSEVL